MIKEKKMNEGHGQGRPASTAQHDAEASKSEEKGRRFCEVVGWPSQCHRKVKYGAHYQTA